MARRLKISEYDPLLSNLTLRFKSWATKTLSFAGRLQLLKSVILGTVNFWFSTFILPLGCIRKVEALCARFLWSGCVEVSKKAKVAWATVCLPKEEGGLGLRRLSEWNKTLGLRFIWLMFSKPDSLWVAWHRCYSLGQKSVWEITESSSDSWTWKQILRLKPLALNFIKAVLGDGRSISFWFDVWTPFGQLITYLGANGPRSLRTPLNAKVADVCNAGYWNLPALRSEEAVQLQVFLTTISPPSTVSDKDYYEWCVDGVSSQTYSASITWSVLRPRAAATSWSDLIWFKGAVPKHSFTMWIANYNRLPTGV